MSTDLIVSPAADQSHTATLRQPRRAVPATTGEPEPVRAGVPEPQHPVWCIDDFDATETGEHMEHSGETGELPLSLPNLDASGRDEAARLSAFADLYAAAAARGVEREPYRPAWSLHLSQPHGGQPVVWLGRDESNIGAGMTPDEAERLGRMLVALAEAGRKDAGR